MRTASTLATSGDGDGARDRNGARKDTDVDDHAENVVARRVVVESSV
jgi:hypothetical protein